MFLAPTFLVNLVAGPGVGLRLHVVLHFVAGFIGCLVLARRHGISGLWSVAPGIVYVFGANFAERATGHVGFTQSVIARLESGHDSRMPTLPLLARIAAATGRRLVVSFEKRRAAG